MAGDWLAAGRIGRPHGLDGSFNVTAPRPALLALGMSVVLGPGGRSAEIVRRAGTDAKPILRVEGVDSREALQPLRGAELLVAREAAPPLEEDEFWAEDLEGCVVTDGAVEVGTVRRMVSLPSCEVLEVERPGAGGGGGDLLVPLVRDAVRSVDAAARRIDVDLAFLGEGEDG